jgi:phosphatidylserine decarboxylase
MVYY